jgi:hypothetical protein
MGMTLTPHSDPLALDVDLLVRVAKWRSLWVRCTYTKSEEHDHGPVG